jgi:effector-binding domain-containing protein
MPSFQVTRSININKSKADIKTILSDFREMKNWSPWLIIEPEATVNYSETQSEVGTRQSWDGSMIGRGSMELTKINDNSLKYDLAFQKPFKSKAKVAFELQEEDDETKVEWTMEGKLPWYLFFMTKFMKIFIGMDYERGLRMLKEYAETAKVSSSLQIIGEGELQEIYYMGLEGSSTLGEIGEVMRKDFETLGAYVEKNAVSKEAKVFAIYNSFDFMKGRTSFVSCVSIEKDDEVPAPFVKGKVEASDVFNIRHRGKYEHLGNAWSLLMNYTRSQKMSIQTKPFGYEFYLNSPLDTPEEELITDVMVRLK